MTATPFSGTENLARALDDGFVVIPQVWEGIACLETMEHALRRLGFPTAKQIGGNATVLRFLSTPEGADAVTSLLIAARLTRRTVTSVALQFSRHPESFAAFGALVKLDAEPRALQSTLSGLWPRRKRVRQ